MKTTIVRYHRQFVTLLISLLVLLSGLRGSMLQGSAAAISAVVTVPVSSGIALLDVKGAVYVHLSGAGAVHVTIDKEEPEGHFRYYDTVLSEDYGSTYRMLLSHCEYLSEQEQYSGSYEITFTYDQDAAATTSMQFVIGDVDFEEQSGTALHFYLTMQHTDQKSGGSIQKKSSHIENEVLLEEYAVRLLHQGSIRGDVDGNDLVDIRDATELMKWYAGKAAGLKQEPLPGDGDVNRDNVIDLNDASCILKYYASKSAGLSGSWEDIV